MTWCEAYAVDYVYGLARNARLLALILYELTQECRAILAPARALAERHV